MRTLTSVPKEVDPVVNSIITSGIAPKQNAFKFKIAPHKQKSIVKMFLAGRWVPQVVNEALCLSTPKYSGKSGTGNVLSHSVYLI
jgi:hypothetical protein